MALHFEEGSVSVFFESNFLEHIDRETIVELFKTQHRLLREGGEIWILTPNIRLLLLGTKDNPQFELDLGLGVKLGLRRGRRDGAGARERRARCT
ncbi:MAG TPA: hypothetical protein H9898_01205 [Candidatus Anaerobiospirillum stercoravium]|nr:hypothetical protein [Candidatus Anaerobiospirillum stercoravium]